MAIGLEVFATGSITQISVSDIARRAGASRALFYHYFPSKKHLIRAIVDHEIAQVEKVANQSTIEDVISAYVGYVKDRPMGYKALHVVGLERTDAVVAHSIQASREHFEALIAYLMDLDTTDPRIQFALRSWTNTMVSTCLEWQSRPQIDQEVVVGMMARTLRALVEQNDHDEPQEPADQ